MHAVVAVLVLLAVAVALAPLADRLALPYPIVLVAGGLLLGYVPALPQVRLEPDLVLLFFLPPLLYWEAVTTSWHDFRADLRPIVSLAVGLVVCTTGGVAAVAHLLLGLPWNVAFVLGAVVSSTDAVSAAAVTTRLGVPRRIVTILSGESLINDATALVVYAAAVTAVEHNSFSPAHAVGQFVLVSVGGVAIGLIAGWALLRLRRRIDDLHVAGTVALLTPFAAYIPADLIGVSGVLAVVTAGLYVGRQSPVAISPALRLRSDAVWELGTFILNALIFIVIGLEFHSVRQDLTGRPIATLLGDVALTAATVIVVRLLWVVPAGALARLLLRGRRADQAFSLPALTIVGWAGMRGVISLATALALPETVERGPFPDRDLILFLTFGVILVTLIGQGLTLAPVIRLLGVSGGDHERREEARARIAVAEAALDHLDALAADWPASAVVDDLRAHYRHRLEQLRHTLPADDGPPAPSPRDLRRELIGVERGALVDLRNRNLVSDAALRRIQRELDLEQVRLEADTQG